MSPDQIYDLLVKVGLALIVLIVLINGYYILRTMLDTRKYHCFTCGKGEKHGKPTKQFAIHDIWYCEEHHPDTRHREWLAKERAAGRLPQPQEKETS